MNVVSVALWAFQLRSGQAVRTQGSQNYYLGVHSGPRSAFLSELDTTAVTAAALGGHSVCWEQWGQDGCACASWNTLVSRCAWQDNSRTGRVQKARRETEETKHVGFEGGLPWQCGVI